MTSKEALKYLLVNSEELYNQYEEDEKFYLDAVELYNIVLKDLEILEILKEHYDVNFLEVSPNYFIAYSVYKDDEDFKKVKEWLNNDSNKRIH